MSGPGANGFVSRINGLFHRLSLSPNHSTPCRLNLLVAAAVAAPSALRGITKPGARRRAHERNGRKLQMFQSSYKLSDQQKQTPSRRLGQVAILYATLYEVESSGGFPAP